MGDALLSLGSQPTARALAKRLGVSLPVTLEREHGPWRARTDRTVSVVPLADGLDLSDLSQVAEVGQHETPEVLVVDATGLSGVDGLDALHREVGPRIRSVRRRLVLLGPTEPIASAAVHGFMRAAAKELGRKGATANLLVVGDASCLLGALTWLMSPRSAFVTGQPLSLSAPGVPYAPMGTAPLAGKRALVTGAARGIGAATARALAREGAKVLVVDRDDPAEVADEIGGEALSIDLTDESAPGRIRDAVGEVHVVVHNAGITRDRTLARMSEAEWDLCLNVNLRAMLRLQAALDEVLGEGARIACLSSIAGLSGNAGQTNYATAKAAVAGWVRHQASHYAQRGVALNAVAPGFIETRMTAAIPLATREGGRRLASLGQGGLPSDVAEVLTFLCSPAAGGLNGQVLRVCGGSLIGA